MHLDEERRQRLLDGELPAAAAADARAHLAGCAECADAFAAAQHEASQVDALLGSLDLPTPLLDAATIADRAGHSSLPESAWLRVAASILVAFGLAAAAYALPGSPLPGWLDQASDWVAGRPVPPPAPDVAPPAVPPPPAERAGIGVAPGEDLLIRFDVARAGGHVRVRLTDDATLVARASSGSARFTSGAHLLVIDLLHADASLTIEVPRSAPRVEMRVGGRQVFLKEGSRVTPGPDGGEGEGWVIPLGP